MVDLARVQFATTSIYHFLFVPLTLGLGPLVAMMQTIWHRTGDEAWLRLTRFFGTLFLINFAIGVATGLVQEFEFGMNWSVYSKFVGNVFGAPLAIEGLAAFMLESTFLGLWIFGWNRLSPRLHLATIWIAVLGTWLSAYFILVANSWMQHPVGYKIVNGEAQLTSVWALLSNGFALRAYRAHDARRADRRVDRDARRLLLAPPARPRGRPVPQGGEARADRRRAGLAAAARGRQPLRRGGHERAEHEDRRLRGAVEHLPAVRLLALPDRRLHRERSDAELLDHGPGLLSYLATGSFDGQVQGLNQLQKQEQRKYGRGNYMPNVRVIYWSMRVMAYRGRADGPGRRRRRVALLEAAARAGALVPVDGDRRDRVPVHRRDRRLDPDRDGPPALDRAGAAADRRRELAERQHRPGSAISLGVFVTLYVAARRRRLRADAPLRAPDPTGRRRGEERPPPAAAY